MVAIPKVRAETRTIEARDGYPLGCTLFAPTGRAPERVVIVASAMAVRRGLYEPYARFLAASGCAALTFDFRGVGGSRRVPVDREPTTIRDWAEQDYAGVIDRLAEEFAGLKLCVVGHSIGGQLLGMIDASRRLDAICTVAAQHGYWRLYPLRDGLRYALLWHLGMPVAARALSYFPGRRLGLGEDLPRGVALEWARWARSRHYMVDRRGAPLRAGFDSYAGPVLAYSFGDDARAPERCVRALHALYARATVEHRHVDPGALGVAGIGHVGFFRPQFKRTLWKESLSWLEAH